MTALLQVEDLTVQFNRKGVAPFTAVDKVSFEVAPGQTSGWSANPAAASR